MNGEVTVILDGEQFDGTMINSFVYLGKRKITYGTQTSMGKSIRESMWEQLDDAMDILMQGMPQIYDYDDLSSVRDYCKSFQRYGHEQGVAQATAYIISLFEDPIHPDIDSVRAAAVMRYKERQELLQLKTPEEVVDGDQENAACASDDGRIADDSDDQAARAGQAREG